MRITRTFTHGDSFQDMEMEQTFIWSEEERRTVPACVRNAVEAAVTIGHNHFATDVEYAFPLDRKGRPTLLEGTAVELPGVHVQRITVALRACWRDLEKSVATSIDGLTYAPDIDRTETKRPFLARMMLMDLLLHENPYGEMTAWKVRWRWSRKDFLQEILDLRSPA